MLKEQSRAFIYIHLLSRTIEKITSVEGVAHWLDDDGALVSEVKEGETINCDDLIYIPPGGRVTFQRGQISGGHRGKTHSFTDPESLRLTASQKDILRLLNDLDEIKEDERKALEKKFTLNTEFSQIYASDYAFTNFEVMAARMIPETQARDLDIVALFTAGNSMCVASCEINIPRLKKIISTLQKPIKPHLVDRATLTALFDQAYG